MAEATPKKVPLDAQIGELQRELRYRRDVREEYAARGAREPEGADAQDAALDAAIKTLTWLKTHEARIRSALK